MRPELKASISKFAAHLAAAERERKRLRTYWGLSNPQIAALVQGKRGMLDAFAEAAFAAAKRRDAKR
jgi:hypothetical protein